MSAVSRLPGETLKLKVATYNIHIGKDAENKLNLEETIKTLQETDADIIGLQEIERHSPRSRFEDQPRLIAEALGLHYHFEPALTVGPFQFGNALLSRYPILSTERIQLKSAKEDRVALLATLQVRGEPVRVMVTHLGLLQGERARDVEALDKRLREEETPLLVLGDFNTDLTSVELKPWLANLHPTTPERIETFPGSGEQIDYVLTSKQFKATKSYTVTSSASDHVPLVSELDWNQE
ncbi:endonuclease/exonuclease/phosphatase family protein [Tumebacillus sp. ITR2]|uniref:Endonuclease/exonuclease/phosphatase family protein n=1 Tax=Tumebacillus amylolyticus TaxID=2801339 RepID=A0ABS1JBM1_9BACL|nr:endonuclease/exonuclease/phosphatase family protein [Tumebacillus amylolyticus]